MSAILFPISQHIFSQKKASLLGVVVLCFVLFSINISFAQSPTQKSLEAKRTRLQLEIKKMNSLLSQSKAEEKNILEDVADLNIKIEIRSKLIQTILEESAVLEKKIKNNEKQIKQLQDEIKVLKEDYADMIYKSYKSKSMQSRLMFILSADSFHQAYKRFQYMTQYTEFRKKQGEEIAIQSKIVEKANDALKILKIEKENLLTEQKEAQQQLEIEKLKQELLIKEINDDKKKYTKAIKKSQKEERRIDKEIEELIKKAIAASNKKSANKKSSNFILTPEAKALASKFENNKGKLPWPVSNALVIRKYGKIPHESIRGITIQSNGIHIATNKKAQATAIFEGTVLAIQVSSNGMKTVYIQHGNYISLYSNLETVSIKKGSKISLKQDIGKIHTDKVTGKTVLKFQIWKDTKTENPNYWLLRL